MAPQGTGRGDVAASGGQDDDALASAPRASSGGSIAWLRLLRTRQRCAPGCLGRALAGPPIEHRFRVRHPLMFKALFASTVGVGIFWMTDTVLVTLPGIQGMEESPCAVTTAKLRHQVVANFAMFLLFLAVRVAVLTPCLAARVHAAEMGLHGRLKRFMVHLLVHGLLYIFSVSSVLLFVQLPSNTEHAEACVAQNERFYQDLKMYATYSSLIGFLSFLLVLWHSKLASQAGQKFLRHRVPPCTVDRLRTVAYNPALFGQEDGKQYPGECPICLGSWEPHDEIKVTNCNHAFHKACLGSWLRKERICALCRRDVTLPAPQKSTTSLSERSSSGPLRVGSFISASAAALSPRGLGRPSPRARLAEAEGAPGLQVV